MSTIMYLAEEAIDEVTPGMDILSILLKTIIQSTLLLHIGK